MEMQEMLDKVKGLINEQADLYKKALDEQKVFGKASAEKIAKLEKMAEDTAKWTNAYNDLVKVQESTNELKKRADELETRLNRKGIIGTDGKDAITSFGELFTESKEFKEAVSRRFQDQRGASTGRVTLDNPLGFVKDLVSEATNQGGVLIRTERRPGILNIPNIPLTVRSILSVGRTSSNAIEYVKESGFTNNAGPQYSPNTSPAWQDGALKNKSELTYTLSTAPVRTLAHYMKASRQILDDVPALQSEINNRLLYGLALEEEREILTGDGLQGRLLGLLPQAADYDTTLNVAGDTKIDKIRHAILQVTKANYMATNVVLNVKDWHDIELIKSTDGYYIVSNPMSGAPPRLWGLPVLASLNMTVGRFLVGNFPLGAQLFDRMESSIQVANQNEDDFIRNLITILAEERVGLAVYRNDAFVEGGF